MNLSRRHLLAVAGSAIASAVSQSDFTSSETKASEHDAAGSEVRLAGRSLSQLRDDYRAELFDRVLPFWDRHGIDHNLGGFMCALDYDGELKHTHKFHWYQGRGIWVYSCLFNHFGKDASFLEIARKAKQFWLRHGRQTKGWWAELVSRTGRVLQPFRGDVYSAFTTADGLQEYAWATGDEVSRDLSLQLLKDAYRHVSRRNYQDPYAAQPGWRVQGIWIYTLNCCTQMLRRWNNPKLLPIADACIEAIIEKHYNPEIGLNNEFLNYDFTRPKSEANKSLVGHCIQALRHVMDEAVRRGDDHLYRLCAQRVQRHLDVGWDHVYGGLCEWVNVNQFSHVWGPQNLGDQEIDLKMTGEYNYLKSFWALNEVLVATLNVYERLGSDWAARYFSLAQDVVERKFSRRRQGQASYLLASNREMNYVPNSVRQDNYHPLRRLMLNLLLLQRLTNSE